MREFIQPLREDRNKNEFECAACVICAIVIAAIVHDCGIVRLLFRHIMYSDVFSEISTVRTTMESKTFQVHYNVHLTSSAREREKER